MTDPDNAHLQIRALECWRGERMLFSDISFDVKPRQLLQVEGANGAGKTSLLRILCGLSRPSEGDILWRGLPIEQQRGVYGAEMAYLGHKLGVKAELSVAENLRIGLTLSGVCARTDYGATLRQVGLANFDEIPGRALSAGQKQRVALARLLLANALLWILDEPYTSLDVTGVALVQGLIEQHLQQGGMAVLTSHHAVPICGDTHTLHLGL